MNSKKDAKVQLELVRETVGSWIFNVTVSTKDGCHQFTIELQKEYYKQLTGGKILPLVLIQESMFYLLEREPVTSILREFDIREINTYFPKYEEEIRQNLGLSARGLEAL